MDIKDLFDHYDFNYNIEERTQFIRNEVSNGNYKVSRLFIYKLEKKFGVCRHIVIPQPIDALVLQVLVEAIADEILEKQPSKNVFYSRDKHKVQGIARTQEYGFPQSPGRYPSLPAWALLLFLKNALIRGESLFTA